jgi:hypothetical protein
LRVSGVCWFMAGNVSPEYTFNIFSLWIWAVYIQAYLFFSFFIVFEKKKCLILNGVAKQNNFQSGPPDVTQLALTSHI